MVKAARFRCTPIAVWALVFALKITHARLVVQCNCTHCEAILFYSMCVVFNGDSMIRSPAISFFTSF